MGEGEFVIVYDQGDWAGVYRDGALVWEGYTTPIFSHPAEFLNALGVSCVETWADTQWSKENPRLPADLADVVFEED